VPLLLLGCGSDRTAGGTTGTEAGNALAARFSLPDGTPAAGALAILRPQDATTNATSSIWIRDTADTQGRFDLRFGDGRWTLEVRCQGFGLRADLASGRDQVLRDTLEPLRIVTGRILGAPDGTVVALPGLGVSVATEADGSFTFDSLPSQDLPLALEGRSGWTIPPDTGAILVPASMPGVVYRDARSLVHQGTGWIWTLPDSLAPDSTALLLDSTGNPIPARFGGVAQGRRRLWLEPASLAGGIQSCRVVPPGSVSRWSPFTASAGFRLAVVPDLDSSLANLVGANAGGFRSSATAGFDSLEGRILSATLGASLGTLDSAALPSTGEFALGFRARLNTASVASLWLLDWTDPATGEGVRVGVGGGRLLVHLGDRDSSVAWDPGAAWSGVGVSWNGRILTVAVDGLARLEVPGPNVPSDRAGWSRRNVGLGGGMSLSALFVLDRGLDAGALSAPPGVLFSR